MTSEQQGHDQEPDQDAEPPTPTGEEPDQDAEPPTPTGEEPDAEQLDPETAEPASDPDPDLDDV